MEKKYRLVVGSPVDYEELVIYVDVGTKMIGLIHKEDGANNLKFEFINVKEKTTIDLDSFIEALQKAKIKLLK